MKNHTVWILEDNPGCNYIYEEILDFRYKTKYFEKISDLKSETSITKNSPDLLIADLRLSDGFFLNTLKGEDFVSSFKAPIIIVSSVDDLDALRFCLERGAADYLIKPFKKAELIVKTENLIKYYKKPSQLMSTKDPDINSVLNDPRFRDLTLKEQRILSLFMQSSKNKLSRENLKKFLWPDVNVHPKTVDVHIHNLKKKIKGHGLSIKTADRGSWSLSCDWVNELT